MRSCAVAVLLLLTACGPAATPETKQSKDTGPGVSLEADDVKALGLETVAAQAAIYQRDIKGYGVVTPLDTVAQSDAEYMTASAAAAQSGAAAARARSLGTGEEAAVSREVVEAAASKAAADQAALVLARRKADSVFGIHAPWKTPAERAEIMARLASGKTVLVRVTFPLGLLGRGTPASLTITRLGEGGQNWTAKKIWDAPADPAFPGRGFFGLVDGSDLAQNEHVIASIPVGTRQQGILVPRSALLMGEGEASVYIENGQNHFLRKRIDIGRPMQGGYFLARGSGFKPGDRIVTAGAGLLLSREINPSTEAGE